MSKPTETQIAEEIAKLKQLEPIIRPYDAFGGDNRAKVRFAIGVLEGKITQDDVDDEEDGDFRSEGDAALEWLNGTSDGAPSENWESLRQ